MKKEYNKDEIKEIIKNEIKNNIKDKNKDKDKDKDKGKDKDKDKDKDRDKDKDKDKIKDKNKNNIKDKIKDENIEIINKKNFECEKCGKDFKYKYLLLKHQNRKFTCETSSNIDTIFDEKIKILENEIENKTKSSPDELKCLFCKKTQTFKNNVLMMLYDNKDKIKIKKNSNLKKIEVKPEDSDSDEDIKPIKKIKKKNN